MFTRVLVANRGEIARRITGTCRRMGITTVAVYSDADQRAPHVGDADLAVRIGPAEASASYLDADRLITAALETGCDAVHPGYGFLSESAAFARATREAGLVFIGPPAEVIDLMGDKAAAKRRVASTGVPVIEGDDRDDLDDPALLEAAGALGFPLLIKAVAGGGGKGMREVLEPRALPDALRSARREALATFGDGRVLLERLVARPRHVEVQVFADRFGRVIHLFERECSIQRRHQKLLEETPSPALTPELRERLTSAAIRVASDVGYEGAGTIEFLLDGTTLAHRHPRFHFLEMNTRLQVEHPVTEAITGLDLVELQLRVAAGEPLPVRQSDLRIEGHAIEVRLYAEDPVTHLPQTGVVTALEVPTVTAHGTPVRTSPVAPANGHMPSVRLDSGVEVGSEVVTHYDPMLAKLIVHASTRDQACAALSAVLGDSSLRGVVTNLPLLVAIAGTSAFRAGELTTGFLDEHLAGWSPPPPDPEALGTAVAALLDERRARQPIEQEGWLSPWDTLGPLRPTGDGGWPVTLASDPATEHHAVVRSGSRRPTVAFDGESASRPLPEPHRAEVVVERDGGEVIWVHGRTGTHRLVHVPPTRHAEIDLPVGGSVLLAPMPGTVIALEVAPGDLVTAGATLVVLEAMKMEHKVLAPADGSVRTVAVSVGQRVGAGATLVALDPDA